MTARHCYNRKSAFTLVEMSVVLMIIGVVVAGGVVMGVKFLRDTQDEVTRSRMDAIDAAILDFRKVNNRLPCPASTLYNTSDAEFGVEAPDPGDCKNGPEADFYLNMRMGEGGIPTKTLNLPDDYAFDGWGRRMVYAVDFRHTAANAFFNYAVTDSCTDALQVKDGAGGTRTNSAIYLLLSHGPNGHGARPRNGSTNGLNVGVTNADELQNCDCTAADTSFATIFANYNGIYVQKAATNDPASALNNFDDILRYKERWQLEPEGVHASPLYPTTWPSLVVGRSAAPTLVVYSLDPVTDTFTQMTAPASLPAGGVENPTFSPDNLYVAVPFLTAPYLYIYKRSCGGALTKITDPPAPAGPAHFAAFSHSGKYLAVAHETPPYLTVYLHEGDKFTALPLTGTAIPNAGRGVSWTEDDSYLVVGTATAATLSMFHNDSTSFSKVMDQTAATPFSWNVSFSRNMKYVAVAAGQGAASNFYLYQHTTGSLSSGPAPSPAVLGSAATEAYGVGFSRDSGYIALSGYFTVNASKVALYKSDPGLGNFTILNGVAGSGISASPAGTSIYLAWSADSNYLAVTADTAPFVTVYRRNGDLFTVLGGGGAPSLPAGGAGRGVAFRN